MISADFLPLWAPVFLPCPSVLGPGAAALLGAAVLLADTGCYEVLEDLRTVGFELTVSAGAGRAGALGMNGTVIRRGRPN